jgi:uncharacterized membrane protein
MAVLYMAAGVNHFRNAANYLRIVPPYLPAREFLVQFSGVAEILLGILLLFPGLRRWAAWGIIALLVAVFPANYYMFQQGGPAFDIPQWILIARLPLQGVLILWAYVYTKSPNP